MARDPLIGKVLGRYRIDRRLGKGSMAVVYRALETRTRTPVAVKILPRMLIESDPVYLERFQREARQAAGLSHENIVRVLDVGEFDGYHALVMQYIDGPTLGELVRKKGPMPMPEAVRSLGQALAGLVHAHSKGIVHRDIKPDNLMRTAKGVVTITDFGLARTADTTQLTLTGQTVGTPIYMSPEQWDNVDVDHRTDQYALGITGYYLLTKRFPVSGESPTQILGKVLSGKRVPLRQVAPHLPGPLINVLERMMAPDRNARYPDCKSAREALAQIARQLSRQIQAPPRASVPPSRPAGLPSLQDDAGPEEEYIPPWEIGKPGAGRKKETPQGPEPRGGILGGGGGGGGLSDPIVRQARPTEAKKPSPSAGNTDKRFRGRARVPGVKPADTGGRHAQGRSIGQQPSPPDHGGPVAPGGAPKRPPAAPAGRTRMRGRREAGAGQDIWAKQQQQHGPAPSPRQGRPVGILGLGKADVTRAFGDDRGRWCVIHGRDEPANITEIQPAIARITGRNPTDVGRMLKKARGFFEINVRKAQAEALVSALRQLRTPIPAVAVPQGLFPPLPDAIPIREIRIESKGMDFTPRERGAGARKVPWDNVLMVAAVRVLNQPDSVDHVEDRFSRTLWESITGALPPAFPQLFEYAKLDKLDQSVEILDFFLPGLKRLRVAADEEFQYPPDFPVKGGQAVLREVSSDIEVYASTLRTNGAWPLLQKPGIGWGRYSFASLTDVEFYELYLAVRTHLHILGVLR